MPLSPRPKKSRKNLIKHHEKLYKIEKKNRKGKNERKRGKLCGIAARLVARTVKYTHTIDSIHLCPFRSSTTTKFSNLSHDASISIVSSFVENDCCYYCIFCTLFSSLLSFEHFVCGYKSKQ